MLYRFAMLVCRALFAALRVRRTATGLERVPDAGGAVLAMTHFGYLEFALVAYTIWTHDHRRVRFLATSAAFRNPVIGWLLRRLGQISVDRTAGAAAYEAAVEALRCGSLVGVFPEAGVDASFTVRELKTGAVRLAAQASVPLIPVAVWGGQRLMTREHRVGFFERFRIPVLLDFAPAVSSAGDRHDATVRLRTALREALARAQGSYPEPGQGQWWQPHQLGGAAPTPEQAIELDAAVVARRAEKRRRHAE